MPFPVIEHDTMDGSKIISQKQPASTSDGDCRADGARLLRPCVPRLLVIVPVFGRNAKRWRICAYNASTCCVHLAWQFLRGRRYFEKTSYSWYVGWAGVASAQIDHSQLINVPGGGT